VLAKPLGEIDIIAARRHTLIFVEVKAHATLDSTAESVTERQMQRIAAAAKLWLAARTPASLYPGDVRKRVSFKR
jgi:Holliday junction resolvase-like predicted endonuclease